MIDWIYFLMLNCSILFILYSIEVPANLLKLTCHEGRVIRDKYLPIPKEIKNFRGFIPILYPISDGIWLYNLKVSFIRFLGYENSGYLTLFSSAGYCEMCFREDIRILIQKAREKNSTLLSIKMKASKDVMEHLISDKDIFKETYLSNSLLESENENSILTLAIVDGNKSFAEFLHKRINDVISSDTDKYKNCDIMYSYEIEGVSDEKNSYSR